MTVLLLIAFFLAQGDGAPAKWDCPKKCEPPGKDVTLLKRRDINERVLSCETPKLPNMLDAKGTVLVEVFVNETGEVACSRAISGMKIIAGPALDAAKKWRFKPLIVDGRAKPYRGFIYVYVSWDVDEMKKRCPNEQQAEQIVGPGRGSVFRRLID